MSAIERVMQRFGFVKLDRYGLVLTPEGRIISLRPAALDDGLHARVVGWRDGDLAAMELTTWEPARPAPVAAVATPIAVTQRPPRTITITPPPLPAVKPVAVVAPTAAVVEPEEDDWEWTIALAKARAAADEPAAPVRRKRADTVPPPVLKTQPLPIVTVRPAPVVVLVPPLAAAPVRPVPAPQPLRIVPRAATSPVTVIPIPKLPSLHTSMGRIEPIVRSAAASPPRRFPKGTGPVAPAQATRSDDTARGVAMPLPSIVSRVATRG